MSKLAEIIANEIQTQGVISFARFSELALYCPVYGYYEKEGDSIGRTGDFYTSVSVGPLFGELLAFQIALWLSECDATCGPLQIVEAGAHDGKLARDILNWLQRHDPGVCARVDYWIVEPSSARRKWQQQTMADFAGKVFWASELLELSAQCRRRSPECGRRRKESSFGGKGGSIQGLIFCNELLDAFPRHRLGWDATKQQWFEWGVGAEGNKLTWAKLESKAAAEALTPALPRQLLSVLPDGFTTEVCPLANRWWRQAADVLACGKLVAIDYGLRVEEFFTPNRAQGTLRAYLKHHVNGDVLAIPGEQDITGHVNFTAVQEAGEASGLRTERFETQEKFLTGIVSNILKRPETFGEWNSKQSRQLRTLIHPEHLGRAFFVLVQSRQKVQT